MYRTFVLWSFNVWIILLPIAAILANIGQWSLPACSRGSTVTLTDRTFQALGVLTIVALLRVNPGENLIKSDISVRLRWYFVITFIVNIYCAGGSIRLSQRSASPLSPDALLV